VNQNGPVPAPNLSALPSPVAALRGGLPWAGQAAWPARWKAWRVKPLDANGRFDFCDCSHTSMGLKSADLNPQTRGFCLTLTLQRQRAVVSVECGQRFFNYAAGQIGFGRGYERLDCPRM